METNTSAEEVEKEAQIDNLYGKATHLKEKSDREERNHFYYIVNAYKSYKINALNRMRNTATYIDSLPAHHRHKLTNYCKHLEEMKTAIDHNFEIIKLIIGDVSNIFENIDYSEPSIAANGNARLNSVVPIKALDSDKVNSVLKQIVREWCDEGRHERQTCFEPILDAIDQYFGVCEKRSEVQILVPGAGLGRLAFEIANRGYACQANEYSLFMLFASNFILNKCKQTHSYSCYPWVQQYHNNLNSCDQLTRVTFPDINPADLPNNAEFSMAGGSFTEIYYEPNCWDCVATCFFIDTANNVVSYIETIWKILKPGGVWINLGPLLYHYADIPNENSIEPSYELLREVIISFGFELINEKTNVCSYYTHNPKSMIAYEYRSVFFVGRKPIS